jgi:MarR family transcriptional regulator, organic hydroperoxide resistance regulator
MLDQFRSGGIVLENALAYWVNRYYQGARREMYRVFNEKGFDLTPEQWMVLVRLWEKDARSQGELCEATTRDAPTMSRIIDSMVKRDLVRRALDEDDARSRIIVLTDRGRGASKVLVPVVRALVARIEHGIPTKDLEITRRTLRRMAENLE